jgi:glycosyltransferase involved in cell wall biosynthesis
MAASAEIQVLAPVSPVRYSDLRKAWIGTRGIPRERRDGPLSITHPPYAYLPFAGAFNAFLLSLQLLRPVARLRRNFSFEVIDCHFGMPEGIAAALLAFIFRRPFTVTLRGSEVEHARHRARRAIMAWALRRAARVIAVSERLKQFALSVGVSPARAVTIPNGVDASVFFQRERIACREKFGIAAGQKIILSAGVLMELKGHHRIVCALRRLLDQGQDASLWIAGGPARAKNFEAEIRRKVAQLGLADKVRFLGHVSSRAMPELMCAADVFCLASSREGCPNVVIEALSSGTPVVATDVGSVPEMIPFPQYGIIVLPNDVPALAGALAQALRHNWDRQAITAWGHSRCWEQVAREALDQMRAVIAEASPNPQPPFTPVARA